MEINITRFFNEADPSEFSASVAEAGYSDIGKRTWNSAKTEGESAPLLTTPDQLDALRRYVKGFGAWSEEEIAAWDAADCNALFIQLVSGDMREGDLDNEPDEEAWENYEKGADEGRHGGNIYRGSDGETYYSLCA